MIKVDNRMVKFFLGALVPVAILGFIFPDRFLGAPEMEQAKYAQHPGADIVAVVRDGCPHCAAFHEFADANGWTVDYHEITNIDTPVLFEKIQKRAPTLNQGVPTIVLNGRVFQGYDKDENSGKGIKTLYDSCKSSPQGCMTFKEFIGSNAQVPVEAAEGGTCTEKCEADLDKYKFNLPLIGEIDLLDYSLVGLSLLLGFLDGFNPCAMWVLITLLTLLINTHDMKKVWVIGGTFLFVSGAIYYMFIAAWLNVFLLIGFNAIVQKVIGTVAIFGGAFYLYEGFGKDPSQCKVTDHNSRQKTISKMNKLLEHTQWPAMIIGVAILAISVNMIELVCTAGLPAVFTQILALNEVSNAARYGYIGLFILMYMIDDSIIFIIAITTLHASGLTTKYRRFTMLFGGFLMYSLGLLLIFAPESLSFDPTH